MSRAAELTLANVLTMHMAKAKSESSQILKPATDLAVGTSSISRESSAKTSMYIGDIVRDSVGVGDVLNMRLVSKGLYFSIKKDFDFMANTFNTLHMNCRLQSHWDELRSLRALQNVACFCNRLSIHLDEMLNPVTPIIHNGVSVFKSTSSIWMRIFAILGSLTTLSISAPGKPDWHELSTGEAILGSIRVALEAKLPAGLHDITLSPINGTGLIHFRWRGAAFNETTWLAGAFWRRLTRLALDLHNPLPYYNKSNQKDFIKTLHDYIGSFSPSLKAFRFSWIGPAGPNPLLLDFRYGGHNFSSPAIKWTALETVYLKNVLVHAGDMTVLRKTRCRNLQDLELVDEKVVWEEGREGNDGLEHVRSRENSSLSSPLSLQ